MKLSCCRIVSKVLASNAIDTGGKAAYAAVHACGAYGAVRLLVVLQLCHSVVGQVLSNHAINASGGGDLFRVRSSGTHQTFFNDVVFFGGHSIVGEVASRSTVSAGVNRARRVLSARTDGARQCLVASRRIGQEFSSNAIYTGL